jgi:thymidylate synthase
MRLSTTSVNAENVSRAWIETCRAVSAAPDRRVFHHVTRIADPTTEEAAIRSSVESILEENGLDPVDTVANTIFPDSMARASSGPAELSERYRSIYPRIRRFPGNQSGTYFGRMVAYPHRDDQELDQLARLLEKFKTERSTPGPMSARYEVSLDDPAADAAAEEADELNSEEHHDVLSAPLSIVVPSNNNARMRFPCLSMCSFQLDGEYLHMVAHYRSQYIIQRAYGNYLGLGRLLSYIAQESGLKTGELMVIAGYAQIDSSGRRRLDRLMRELD